jgi:hypothetical protein
MSAAARGSGSPAHVHRAPLTQAIEAFHQSCGEHRSSLSRTTALVSDIRRCTSLMIRCVAHVEGGHLVCVCGQDAVSIGSNQTRRHSDNRTGWSSASDRDGKPRRRVVTSPSFVSALTAYSIVLSLLNGPLQSRGHIGLGLRNCICGGPGTTAETLSHLKVRSCLIDGEVVCCDEKGWRPERESPVFWNGQRSSGIQTQHAQRGMMDANSGEPWFEADISDLRLCPSAIREQICSALSYKWRTP